MSYKEVCWYTPELQNRSSDLIVNDLALISINTLAILLNVCANGFVVYTYLGSRSTQPISNTLLFLLATFDLLQGIISHPILVATKVLECLRIFNCNLQIVSTHLDVIFAGFSFLMVAFVVTSERLFAILYPIRHRVYMQRKRIVTASLSLFVFWVALVVSLIHISLFAAYIVLSAVSALGLIYSLSAYITIYGVIKKSAELRGSEKSTGPRADHTMNESQTSTSEKQTKSTKATEFGRDNCKSNEDPLEFSQNAENAWEPQLPEISQHQANSVSETVGGTTRSNETIWLELKASDGFQGKNLCEKAKLHYQNGISQVRDVLENLTVYLREKRTIRRMLCILGALYVCHLPVLCCYAVYLYLEGADIDFFKRVFPWSSTLCFSATILNPFIYCYKNEQLWSRRSTRNLVS